MIRFMKKKSIIMILLLAAAGGVLFAVWYLMGKSSKVNASAEAQRTAAVQIRSIASELSSSGTISAKDAYNLTSLVEGEVLNAEFEEGDQVEKDQVLYVIDSSSMETELSSSENSVGRAQNSYETAVADYNEAMNKYSGNTYKSGVSGYIKKLYIEEGDKINSNAQIADVYDDTTMKIKLPFLSVEAAVIGVGNAAVVTLTDTLEQLPGVVTGVSTMDETLTGGRMVRYVTIQVTNPGGLTSGHVATAMIGDYTSSLEGNFEATVDKVMSADLDGSVEVGKLLVAEGDYVSKDSALFVIETRSVEKMIKTYQDAVDKAKESMENAESKLESNQDKYDNYTIKAPISGQVITKNVKVGDNISVGSNGTGTLAVIYDLSSYTFEMLVDELDVTKVKVGQTVAVTADAFEGQEFTGTVTNVSLESTYSNGVSTYPVTVTLGDTGSLLPGMNVDGVITLEQAENCLTVPVDALKRGNQVYVKDDTVKEENGAVPAGFRSVEVETGLINDDYVEIISGLNEGDEVYLAESSTGSTQTMMPGMQGAPGGGMQGGPSGGMQGGQRGGSSGGNPGGSGRP